MIEWKKWNRVIKLDQHTMFLVTNGSWVITAYPSAFEHHDWIAEGGNVEGVTHYAEINLPLKE